MLITHAHIDHSGLLPRLAAEGFRGPIYATEATADLLEVMLLDAAHIQEKEAEWRERGRRRREAAAPPLYTVIEAQACLAQLKPVAYDAEVAPHPSVRCRFRDAGHILGSAIVEARVTAGGQTRRLVFSGDLGQPGRPIVRDPTPVTEADTDFVPAVVPTSYCALATPAASVAVVAGRLPPPLITVRATPTPATGSPPDVTVTDSGADVPAVTTWP